MRMYTGVCCVCVCVSPTPSACRAPHTQATPHTIGQRDRWHGGLDLADGVSDRILDSLLSIRCEAVVEGPVGPRLASADGAGLLGDALAAEARGLLLVVGEHVALRGAAERGQERPVIGRV